MDERNRLYLIIKEKEKQLYKVRLRFGKEYRIGRNQNVSDVVIGHARISRRHCSIRYDKEKNCLWVKDFSSNGCTAAGRGPLIRNVYVKVGLQDEIRFNHTDYCICVETCADGFLQSAAGIARIPKKVWREWKPKREKGRKERYGR